MIYILLSVRWAILLLHLLQLSERDVRSILPVANNCGNIHVRFSTFFILENEGKVKKR